MFNSNLRLITWLSRNNSQWLSLSLSISQTKETKVSMATSSNQVEAWIQINWET